MFAIPKTAERLERLMELHSHVGNAHFHDLAHFLVAQIALKLEVQQLALALGKLGYKPPQAQLRQTQNNHGARRGSMATRS